MSRPYFKKPMDKLHAFMEELEALCKKHGVVIGGGYTGTIVALESNCVFSGSTLYSMNDPKIEIDQVSSVKTIFNEIE